MSVPLRNRGRWGLAGMQRDKAPVKWPRSEGGGTRLRGLCLDGCYGNRRQREALCIVTLAESSGEKQKIFKKGKEKRERREAGRRRTGVGKGREGKNSQTTSPEQTAKGTRQHCKGARRQISA